MAEQVTKPPLDASSLPIKPAKSQKKRNGNQNANKSSKGNGGEGTKGGTGGDAVKKANAEQPSHPNPQQSAPHVDEDDDGEEKCVVCCESMHESGLGECGHRVCCGLCTFRLRLLHKDEKCVMCKQRLERVFIVRPDDARSHEDLVKSTWGRMGGTGLVIDEQSDIFYTRECMDFKERMDHLRQPRCDECPSAQRFATTAKLEKHLSEVHGRLLCKLCLDHRGLFIMEHTRYTAAELAAHSRPGGENSLDGHPQCKFCKQMSFYNMDALYKHLNEQHESCHLCAKQGNKYQYFRDYRALEAHFSHSHFACEDPRCKESRFVAFLTELQLQAHIASEHPERADSRHNPLSLDFVYRGSRRAQHLGGGEDEEEEDQHSRMSSVFRREDAESFPPLPGGGGGLSSLSLAPRTQYLPTQTVALGRTTSSDFPALRAPSSSSRSSQSHQQQQQQRRYLSTATAAATRGASPSPSPSPPLLNQAPSSSLGRPTPAQAREVSAWCSRLIDGEVTVREMCDHLISLIGERNFRSTLPDIKAVVGDVLAREIDACMNPAMGTATTTSAAAAVAGLGAAARFASKPERPAQAYQESFPALGEPRATSASSRLSRAEVRELAFSKKAPVRAVAAPVGVRPLERGWDEPRLDVSRPPQQQQAKSKGKGKSQRQEIMEMALKFG